MDDLLKNCFVGIDVGAQKSVAALWLPSADAKDPDYLPPLPFVINNEESALLTPTTISYVGRQRLVGQSAIQHAGIGANWKSTVSNVKSLLGTKGVPQEQEQQQFGPPKQVDSDGRLTLTVEYDGKSVDLLPESVLAVLLGRLRRSACAAAHQTRPDLDDWDAGRHLDSQLKCVVSVPPSFSADQVMAVARACTIAGFRFCGMCSDSLALSVCYAATHRESLPSTQAAAPVPDPSDQGKQDGADGDGKATAETAARVLIVDVGHVHATATLAEMTRERVTVLAQHSTTDGGAQLVDVGLSAFLQEQFKEPPLKLDISKNARACNRLMKEISKAKAVLSTIPQTVLTIESLADDKDVKATVTREQLTMISQFQVEAVVALVKKVLHENRAAAVTDQLRVELVGGGTRAWLIRQSLTSLLQQEFGLSIDLDVQGHTMDSNSSVAQGAAVLAFTGCAPVDLVGQTVAQTTVQDHPSFVATLTKTFDQLPADSQPELDAGDAEPKSNEAADGRRTSTATATFQSMFGSLDTQTALQGQLSMDLMAQVAQEREFRELDQAVQAVANARNRIEDYFLTRRNQLTTDSELMQAAGADVCAELTAKLTALEEWFWDQDDQGQESLAVAQKYTDKQQETEDWLRERSPAALLDLLQRRQDEKRAEQLAMAEAQAKLEQETAAAGISETKLNHPRSVAEKLEAGNKRKEQGNLLFKEFDYKMAAMRYIAGISLLDKPFDKDADGCTDEQLAEQRAVLRACFSNLAECYIKLKAWKKAELNAGEALALDSEHCKSLYRRAFARYNLKQYDESKQDCETLLALDSANSQAQKLLARVSAILKKQKAKEKEMYGKMFS